MRCATKYCRRVARKQRRFCCTCADRKWRARHPMRYLWKNLKSHAKERGHAFTLTFEQWRKFCEKTRYHVLKGREPDALTVERIDESKGYHAGNITVLRHADNIRRNFVPYFKQQPAGCVQPDDQGDPW